ncbi:MAG: alpha/beta hydrolase [Solirubrobacteraceae bacterium]|nr:alpha/beta hydrolase [Solirubrobacteraceae bacterium]
MTTGATHTDETFALDTADGVPCNVIHVRGRKKPTKGPVLLVHGVGVRTEIWRPPNPTTIVDALLEAGYDVWMETWRASMDVPNNTWTLDQAAVLDHPLAVAKVLEQTGASSLQAVTHCQGSTSFMMSACAGLIPEVRTIVASAVTLHPVVPRVSGLKLRYVVPPVSRLLGYLDPRWGRDGAPWILPKLLTAYCMVSRRKCDNGVCKVSSFMFGSGDPTLWTHEQLSAETHEWTKGEFGPAPLTFFKQISQCVRRGHLVSVDGRPELPASFVAQPPQTDARFVLITGGKNHCFLPESQRRTYEWLEGVAPGRHALHIVAGYGHLDVFVGMRADEDWFPLIVSELDKA